MVRLQSFINRLRHLQLRGSSTRLDTAVSFDSSYNGKVSFPGRVRQLAQTTGNTCETSVNCILSYMDKPKKSSEALQAEGGMYRRFSANAASINGVPTPSYDIAGRTPPMWLVVVLACFAFLLPLLFVFYTFSHSTLHHKFQASVLYDDQIHYSHPNIYNTSPKLNRRTLPRPQKPDYAQCRKVKVNSERFDCYPEAGATMEGCEARGCCWLPIIIKENSLVPFCFYPQNFTSYRFVNVTQTVFGYDIFMTRSFCSPYPADVNILQVIVKYETVSRLHIKIKDPLRNRFEPPYPEVPNVDRAATDLLYSFNIDEELHGFKVLRKSDGLILFDTTAINNLIFADQFLQITSTLPSRYVYGLGEHRSNFLLSTNWTRLTMFNRDGAPDFDINLYGSHPFYLSMEPSTGNAHGVFLRNSNAMEVILQPRPAITFRSIGGVFDLYVFVGPSPANVISQYTELIGRPAIPPYWSLGFHLCRFGYHNVDDTRTVLEHNLAAGIPIDTQWNDLDYMNNSNDFTYDHKRFGALPEFIHELHARGMHYVVLIDPGVSAGEPKGTYKPYDEGIKYDIFVKTDQDRIFVGKVWNSLSTVWPDFTNPNAVPYWSQMFKELHDEIKFDGAWIDMNEPSNFLSGSFNGCNSNSWDYPPYTPIVAGNKLYYKTLCMSAQHYAGRHYDIHNLYGLTEAIITSFALAEIRGLRPFTISRSTFPGIGRYSGHWSGDIYSKWLDMRYTVPQILSFSLFGVPLMGADICGFNGNATESLCNRWMQLGAFYPFSRNHNTDDGIAQDPVSMGPLVTNSSVRALSIRYRLLPYLYTLFWHAQINGDTVARALLFEFPKDEQTYSMDKQFLWGPALLIIPVLDEDTDDRVDNVYLAGGNTTYWYDYYSHGWMKGGQTVSVPAPLNTIPLFVRGGHILPQQGPAQTTTKSRTNHMELLVAPDSLGNAYGMLYWDDGDSLNTFEENRYSLIKFTMITWRQLFIQAAQNHWWEEAAPPNLGLITVLGLTRTIHSVYINGKKFEDMVYDKSAKFLRLYDLDMSMQRVINITWNTL